MKLERQVKKGKKTLTPNENPEDKADRDARARCRGTVPPSTSGAALGPTENPGRQRSTTLTNAASGGSGGGAPLKKPKKSAVGGNPDDSSDNSDGDLSDNEGELPKKKLTSNQLLHKYLKAMIADQKSRDKADAPKLQPYKGNPEDLERFIRHLENVWVLESHKYKKDIIKIRYAANLVQMNGTDRHTDLVKWYEAYHPKINLAAALRLPGGAKGTFDPVWTT